MTIYVMLIAGVALLLILRASSHANKHRGIGYNGASGGAWIAGIVIVAVIAFVALHLGLFTF
jgi:hypothetical protein